MTKHIYELTNEEMDAFIQNLLPVKKIEKDKYGEVFTDPDLINRLLDLLPNTVWSKPHLKWLDPSVGAGFFMIFVYQRLMHGLTSWEPNPKKRSTHIIKNMLYMVELNKTNCNLCTGLFGHQANLVCSDFLSDFHFPGTHEKKDDPFLFDCIVGNPPFQDDYGLTSTGNRITGGKNKLYERIFLKAYGLLQAGGYLSFIVPDNLFSGNGSQSYKLLLENAVPFVSFNPSNQSFFPGIQQTICYFLLKKVEKKNDASWTIVEQNDTNKIKIRLQDRPVNPVRKWTKQNEQLISSFVSNKRNQVVYNRGKTLSYYKDTKNGAKYPIVYTPSKTLYTNNEELAVGLKQKKAIIFSISTDFAFKMDYSGKYGCGPNTFYIPFQTSVEGKRLETFLRSDDYKSMANATKTTRQYLKIAFLEHLQLDKILKQGRKTFRKKFGSNKKGTRKTRKTVSFKKKI